MRSRGEVTPSTRLSGLATPHRVWRRCIVCETRGSRRLSRMAPDDEKAVMSSKLVGRIQDIPGRGRCFARPRGPRGRRDQCPSRAQRRRGRGVGASAGPAGRLRRSLPGLSHLRGRPDPDHGGPTASESTCGSPRSRAGHGSRWSGSTVRSFRVVPPDPTAIAQGLADAWCQVLGRPPVEISRVSVTDEGTSCKWWRSTPGSSEPGEGDLAEGWTQALAIAVGEAIGVISKPDEVIDTNVPSHCLVTSRTQQRDRYGQGSCPQCEL